MIPRIVSCLLFFSPFALGDGALDDARSHFGEGRLVEALEAARSVGVDDPGYARARFLAGEIRLLLGDAPAAEASFREALEARPDSAPILTGIGRALLAQGRAADALGPLEKAVAADAGSARARCFLGVARVKTGDLRRGRADIGKARKQAPDDPEIARAVVLVWMEEGDLERAMRAARAFSAAARGNPMGPFLVAMVLEKDGEDEEAIAAYERVLALDENFLDAHKNLAILCIAHNPLYTDRERTAKAMKHFERYFALGGRDAEVRRIHETLKQFLAGR